MSEKQANVGDLAEVLIVLRNNYQTAAEAIDEFLNKLGEKILAPTGVGKFTKEQYESLRWNAFQTKKNQTWHRLDFNAEGIPAIDKEIIDHLVDSCMSPSEATIQAPFIAYEQGYWIYKEALYRRPMPTPR